MDLIQAMRDHDLKKARVALKADPKAAKNPRAIVAAGGQAFQPGLALLAKHGADLNAIHRGYRALHNLIQERPHGETNPSAERLACLDWLLANGADPELPGAWPPARAMIVAAFMGESEFVKRLSQNGAKIDGFVFAALGDCKKLAKLLRNDPLLVAKRDAGGLTALQCAAGSSVPKGDSFACAKILLDAGADPHAKTKSWSEEIDVLYLAARAPNRAVFELLLDRGANADEGLTHALWGAKFDLSQIAIDRGAKPDRAMAAGQPLLTNLIRWGQFKQAMWLLERGASPNVPDARGWTAMHQVASRGNEKMLCALIEADGDLTTRDAQGNLPRDIATKDKIVALLNAPF